MTSLFKHVGKDLSASIVVFFVALPLCLGIALASGAPLFSGLIAGIIGFYQLKDDNQPTNQWQNASVQTKETHDYFASVVEKELIDLKSKQTPETKEIINDALNQMKVFDQDYQKIISELQKNGDTKQLLHAMILNFQTRISFLEEVIKKIEIIY